VKDSQLAFGDALALSKYMIEKLVPVTICVMGICVLCSGVLSGCDDGRTQFQEHFVTEEVLNTKLATLQGQVNTAFDKHAMMINMIGEYLERLQKKGALPKTSEVLPDRK